MLYIHAVLMAHLLLQQHQRASDSQLASCLLKKLDASKSHDMQSTLGFLCNITYNAVLPDTVKIRGFNELLCLSACGGIRLLHALMLAGTS